MLLSNALRCPGGPLGRCVVASAVIATAAWGVVANAQPASAPSVSPPTVLQHVDATYPVAAMPAGKHADVALLVTIDVDGHVSKVEVAESGGKELDEAASTAMRQWTFRPATRDGRPIASRIRVPFHFAPAASQPEAPPGGVAPRSVQGGVSNQTGGVGVAGPSPAAVGAQGATPSPGTEEVRVIGRAQPPSRGASDFNLRVGELARVPRQNASELLKLAPGILLTNEGGDGHAEQVFMRGFDAREGQDVEFTVGGVPINESGNLHGNGYADTHFIIPELVQSLRVLEGPFDPRQGNYAVAGSADYELGLEKRGLTAKYMRGSFGTERMVLLWGPKNASTGTFGGVELYRTDGFGSNRDAQRGTAMGQYEGALGEHGHYRVTATAYSGNYHSAGVLRDDDFRSGRVGFFDTYDYGQGGASSRYSVAGEVETKSEDTTYRAQVFAIQRGMRIRENFTGFLLDVQDPLQNLHSQRGDLLDLDVSETTVGSKGFARHRLRILDQPQEIEFGYFARGDLVSNTQQRIEAANGHPYRLESDNEAKLGDLGAYGDLNLRATNWLALRGGARADIFTFDVLDKCAVQSVAHPSKSNPPGDASCISQEDFGRYREPTQRATTASTAVMPRGSVIVGPFQHFSLSGGYGTGVRSIDPSYITQDVKTPFASIQAYEGGVVYSGRARNVEINARSIFFETKVDRDLIFSETAGRNVLGNGTTRTGWVGALRLTGEFFDEAANVTLVRSTFDDTHLLVAYVPDVVVRSDTALFAALPWKLSGSPIRGALGSGVTYVGHRALPYGQRSDVIFTIDTSATLAWREFEVGFIATNLLDRRYRLGEYNYASDFHTDSAPTLVPTRHFTAGAPRSLFATLSITLGGNDAH